MVPITCSFICESQFFAISSLSKIKKYNKNKNYDLIIILDIKINTFIIYFDNPLM
jgi:hypothetical protein